MKYARNSHGEARAPVNTLDRLIETPGDFHVTRGSSAAAQRLMRGSSRVSYASFEILTPKWDHWPKCHTRHTVHNMFCKVTSLVASKYDVLTEGRVGVDQEMPQICGQICGQRWDGVKIPNFLLMSFMKDTEMEIGKALTAFGFSLPRNHRVHIRARRNAAQVTLFPWLNFFHESTFSEPFTAVQCVPVEKAHGFVQQKCTRRDDLSSNLLLYNLRRLQ